jgi:predicted helicase
MGNPPYSGVSANRSKDESGKLTFIGKLIEDYKQVNGIALNERKHWLQDDYVKFIRFAEWRLTESNPKTANTGVIAFITNNGYLDNPTFRGMRTHLLKSFSKLFLYNLHGSSNKSERGPGGSYDENVFDIQQGVSILLAVRTPGHEGDGDVFYADLWGDRQSKYALLNRASVEDTEWVSLVPSAPNFLFTPTEPAPAEYADLWSLPEIMPLYGSGITTARDAFAVDFLQEPLLNRMKDFVNSQVSDAELKLTYGLEENYAWRLAQARIQASQTVSVDGKLKTDLLSKQIHNFLYRPFDLRQIYYDEPIVWRTRRKVMANMLVGKNLCLLTTRLTKDEWACSVSNTLTGHKSLSAYDITYCFPMLVEDAEKGMFSGRAANLSSTFLSYLGKRLNLLIDSETSLPNGISVEHIFGYIYAVTHAPRYKERYEKELVVDFPRIPVTSNLSLFLALAEKGRQLVAFHLLKAEDAPQLDQFITQFPIAGNNEVTKVKYTPENGRVAINDDQYFSRVPAATWNFHVGGYQVCEKWLKDRKGRFLTYDDTQHWQRTVVALTETQRIMQEIDALIPSWPLQ